MRGHLGECVKHFCGTLAKRTPRGSRRAAEVRKPLAVFCGVAVETTTRWAYHEELPVGETRLRLMAALDALGYKVIELENMPKHRRGIAELIGFGVATSSAISQALGYKSVSTLYQVLAGGCGTSEEKMQEMWNIWKQRKEDLQRKRIEAQQQLRRMISPKAESEPQLLEGDDKTACRAQALGEFVEGLQALFREKPVKDLSDSELAILQYYAGAILNLVTDLSALSSRLLARQQQKGGVTDGQR